MGMIPVKISSVWALVIPIILISDVTGIEVETTGMDEIDFIYPSCSSPWN